MAAEMTESPRDAASGRRGGLWPALVGLALSGLVVAGLGGGAAWLAGAAQQAEMRALFDSLPVYRGATVVRIEEKWDNLYVYWQSEATLPRIVGYFHSEHPEGAVTTFYKELLTAAGWEPYQEPWALYPAYRRGKYRLAVLFQRPFAQNWQPAGDYQVHLWSLPLLEGALGRDPEAAGH